MKWLVEHNAAINVVNSVTNLTWRSFMYKVLCLLQKGRTPFMLACGSCIDRSSNVRYFGEKGADYLAKDDVGLRFDIVM